MKTDTLNKQDTTLDLEAYFKPFRAGVIGNDATFKSLYGKQNMLYADWIASGRLYQPIENVICEKVGPMMANTHSFSSESGKATTYLYHEARNVIKQHVNASEEDVLVTTGTGMTGALNKLLRILKLLPANLSGAPVLEADRPVVFITHMEHHSNQVCWFETEADVVILPPDDKGLVATEVLENEIKKYSDRKYLIGAFTACSNVTGIISPYQELAKIMHKYGGLCFVDFAASAPYVNINMHPENEDECLDAIFFSPHKFLGGPGSCGVLVYNKNIHQREIPDNPGGGNVKWTKPSGEFKYVEDPETREDGGTPGIIQVIRAALVINLKEKMNVDKMKEREDELLKSFYDGVEDINELTLLGTRHQKQIGCVSFNIDHMHYNLAVRLLNDRFGIQVRGGWSCASTYAHYLCGINAASSSEIIAQIEAKNLTEKPGWVRLSIHPTMSNKEITYVVESIKEMVANQKEWSADYTYNSGTNEFDSITPVEVDLQHYADILSL
ncbi:aminotransferase class V-fold PLP-dependent enzyme [Bizionia gelidisalsuginis]|uniref:Aminotransferase class V-fold PLP-dependent enzyme n=1 Tax=Bizionia gelidisalsuginis TaxID=291188 RepID=A0ABY3M9Y3_9FLAO|nr:aminotransferase class V-fold PLP-dependent enzyme [Bizionia gelidisalsuginis]TYC12074.1 aminotransferase class V-fold PLP-dependent enzyme [Bizionia gelidisalsuginis]